MLLFCLTYVVNAARNKFRKSCLLQPGNLVTLFTVLPTFTRASDSTLWFSFGYLRIYSALVAYEKIEKTGVLHNVSEMTRGYIVTGLRTLVLVVILVGTTLAFEIIGDPELLVDSFVITPMGEVSVIQMTYWIFTTISTVGYGDFAPTFVLSRLFIIVAIVVGVCFFSTELGSLMELHNLESTGKGKFKPTHGGKHVVLMGGGVREVSSVLMSFLDELFRMEHGDPGGGGPGWPHLSLMASVEQPSQLKEAIESLPKHARLRIKYFVGDPTSPKDLARLRVGECNLVVVIASLQAPDPDSEDQSNILRGLAVTMAYPSVNLRLMLLRPSSKARAVRLGFKPSRCFSINEQKSGLLSLSCLCRGFSSMITFFLTTENSDDLHLSKRDLEEPWLRDYKNGRRFILCGFCINPEFEKKSFIEFARKAVLAQIVPLGVQIESKFMLNPTRHVFHKQDVVFALAPSEEALIPFQDPHCAWRQFFLANQHNARRDSIGVADYTTTTNDTMQGTLSKTFSGKNSTQSTGSAHDPVKAPSKGIMPWQPLSSGGTAQKNTNEVAHNRSMTAAKSDGLTKAKENDNDPEWYGRQEEKATAMAREGGHYMLVVLAGNPWQQVQAFLKILRGKHVPFHIPVMILAPPPTPPRQVSGDIFEANHRVAYKKLAGAATVNDLMSMGLPQARCVLLFAGNAGQASSADRRMVDGAGVTMLSTLEWELSETGTPGIPIKLELHQQESLRFLHRFPLYDPMSSNSSVPGADQSFINHPRFASGDIFTASCLGALMATAFYTPGVVEILDSLILGQNSMQTSFPWQIAVPKEVAGKTYADCVRFLLGDSWSALCMGLYRVCFPDTGSMSSYVITNPEPSTVLREDDLVIVLGTAEFGQRCFDLGLIVGATGAPSCTDLEESMSPSPDSSPMVRARDPCGFVDSSNPNTADMPSLREEATVSDAVESSLPSLPHMHQELLTIRGLYSGSLRREAEQFEELKLLRQQIKKMNSSRPVSPRSNGPANRGEAIPALPASSGPVIIPRTPGRS